MLEVRGKSRDTLTYPQSLRRRRPLDALTKSAVDQQRTAVKGSAMDIRKTVTLVEEINSEYGAPANPPLRRWWPLPPSVQNPLAGKPRRQPEAAD
jgi:hypothetical protein